MTAETFTVNGCDGCDGKNTTPSFIFSNDLKTPSDSEPTINTQTASQSSTNPEPGYTDDDIIEIIEFMCLCEDKEALTILSRTYQLDDPELKQRVWAKMTSEQQTKVKAIANTLPNGVEIGKEYTAVNGERLRLLEVFEHTTFEGDIILMGQCEYLSDGAACETRLDFLHE